MAEGRSPYPTGNEKWQFLKKFIINDCGPSWTVYFETLLPALGAALMMLISTSTTDVARAVFRPTSLGGHHKRRGRKGRGQGSGIPQSEEIIAEYIGGEGLADTAHYSAGAQNVWRMDAFAQELFYYFLIADVVDEFYFQWLSGIVKRSPSDCGNIAHLTRNGSAPFSGPFDGFIPLTLANLVSENMALSNAQGTSLPPGNYNIILSGKVENNGGFGHPAQYQVRFWNGDNSEKPYTYSDRVQLYPGEYASLIAQNTKYLTTGTDWQMGKFAISGIGSEGYFHDFEISILAID